MKKKPGEMKEKYPGVYYEMCYYCGQQIYGCSGRHEDSLYDRDGNGPYCIDCFRWEYGGPEYTDEQANTTK